MTFLAEHPLLTLQQTADCLAVSPRLVRSAAHDGRLPSVRFGRLLRFRAEDVETFITAHLRGGASHLATGEPGPPVAA